MSIRMLLRSKVIPDSVKDCFKKTIITECGEQALWREVVVRVVLDAYGNSNLDPEGNVRDARAWFQEWEDVEQVFSLAGIEPKIIVAEVEKLSCP